MEDVLESAAVLSEEELDEILAELEAFEGKYPKEAIAQVRLHQTAMIPKLIRAIEEAIVEAREYGDVDGSAAFLGLALLGEFQAKEALPVILQAISLPDDLPFEIFGDVIHEILPRVLADLSDSTDVFDRLIADASLNEYVRAAAGRAYLESVYLGRLTRAEAVGKLQEHLRTALAAQDRRGVNWLVMNLANFGPAEAMEEIREAFRKNLVDQFLIGIDEFDEILARDEFSKELERIAAIRQQPAVDQLESWCWERDEDETAEWESSLPSPQHEFDPWTDEDDFDEEDVGLEPEPLLPAVGTIRYTEARVGRNEPCPCGSGKKFKKCCGGG